jgi:hypothetical protein
MNKVTMDFTNSKTDALCPSELGRLQMSNRANTCQSTCKKRCSTDSDTEDEDELLFKTSPNQELSLARKQLYSYYPLGDKRDCATDSNSEEDIVYKGDYDENCCVFINDSNSQLGSELDSESEIVDSELESILEIVDSQFSSEQVGNRLVNYPELKLVIEKSLICRLWCVENNENKSVSDTSLKVTEVTFGFKTMVSIRLTRNPEHNFTVDSQQKTDTERTTPTHTTPKNKKTDSTIMYSIMMRYY